MQQQHNGSALVFQTKDAGPIPVYCSNKRLYGDNNMYINYFNYYKYSYDRILFN